MVSNFYIKCRGKCNFAYFVASLVPITNEQSEISIRVWIRHWDDRSMIDIKCSKPSSCFMKLSWWQVCVGSNLILWLKLVCVIWIWRYRTVCSQYPILPWIFPLFNSIPGLQQQCWTIFSNKMPRKCIISLLWHA